MSIFTPGRARWRQTALGAALGAASALSGASPPGGVLEGCPVAAFANGDVDKGAVFKGAVYMGAAATQAAETGGDKAGVANVEAATRQAAYGGAGASFADAANTANTANTATVRSADAELATQRGGAATTVDTRLTGQVSGNVANNVQTGWNVIDGGAFANMTGIPIIVQNTGANVLIQNATVIHLQLR